MKQQLTKPQPMAHGIAKDVQGTPAKDLRSTGRAKPVDPLNMTLRLGELAKLKNGWLDGKGRAPAKKNLDLLASTFDSFFDADLPLPYLYPTAEGGVQAEWSLSGWEVSLEIDLDKQEAQYQALNLKDHSSEEFSFSLPDRGGWDQLNQALKLLYDQNVEEQASGF